MSGPWLKELREKARVGQGEVAAAMDWSQSWLSKIESGAATIEPSEVHRVALTIHSLKLAADQEYEEAQRRFAGTPAPQEAVA